MYKNKMISFAAGVFMLAPLVVSAQTDTLTALQQQIAALQQQLMSLQGKQSGGGSGLSLPTEKPKPVVEMPQQRIRPGDQPEDEDTTTPITFDRDLYLGLRNDSDVSNLQEFLTDQGFYNQTISGNFFILTRNAVKKFQASHGIKPSGYFGSLTRTVANKILAGEEVLPSIPPHTPPPFPVSTGHLNIDPAYAMVKIGEAQRIRAIFTPPRPACLDANPSCKMPERAPYEVQASFVSENPKIATADEAVSICPVSVSGIQSSCPDPLHFVRGISGGETVITASYTDSAGRVHAARMKVSVSDGAVSQNLPPVISGLKGPTALKVNEAGTWAVQAHDPENGPLAYHITWGDEEIGVPRASQAPSAAERITQTATFTHAYAKAGTFTPLFVVVDEGGLSAQTSASVAVGTNTSRPLMLTAPNGGQQWQLNSLHTITWAPYDPNSDVNPAKEVTAYLERMVSGQYVTVGKVIESGKASIHWIGEIDTYGNYPSPGDYYIRIVNNRTGEADRSDAVFTLVPAGTLTADIKVNGLDGPIAVPAGGTDYVVSWQSGASSCSIYNNTASNSGGAQLTNLHPTGSQVMHFTENSQAYAQYISLECLSKSPVEGSASDNVQLLPSAAPLTVLSPNGGETLDWAQSQSVTWTNTAEVAKISLALYKNDKWFAWITPSYAVSAGKNFYTWTPSQTISQSDVGGNVFKIYMIGYKTSGGTVEDKSDAPFSIATTGAGGTFSIADISGIQSAYAPGQQIKLTVKGIESDGSPATSGEGFNVQTYIYDAGRTKTYAGVNGTYNASTGHWDVLLDAPSASNVSYDLEVFLYCSNDSAVCASKYGRAAQVTTLFKFTLLPPVSTDLRITNISRATFHPYGFNMTICTDGSQSINDLKKTIQNLTSFPTDYVVYDRGGNRYRGDASSGGSAEDMKNGQCQTLGWTIQQSEQAYYDQTKKVELVIDAANLIAETNESNNSLVFVEPQPTKMQVLSPNGGETLVKGQQATISWTGGYPTVLDSNSVALQLQRPDGNQVGWISFGNQPSGTFSWDPAKVMSAKGFPYNVDVPDGQYKVAAIDYNSTNWQGPGINNIDQSDGAFTVATLLPSPQPQ